jgi:hypothetical protein
MIKSLSKLDLAATVLLCALGSAAAQVDSPQPSRNDPPPQAPNQTSKDPVPPATDESLPTRGGKQEPSSKIEGTDHAAVFVNGVLTAPGAQADSETAPAKHSARSAKADELPIAAYALRHLSTEQKERIYRALHQSMAIMGGAAAADFSIVGAEVPTEVALEQLQQLPRELVSEMPELGGLAFTRTADKVLLVSPTMHRVLAVIG